MRQAALSSPSVVQGLQYAFRPAPFFEACGRRFGEVFTLRLPVAPRTVVMFTSPEAIREIFTRDDYEMKVVLAEVLSRVELRLAAGYRMRPVRRSITLAPSRGMPVVVARRAA